MIRNTRRTIAVIVALVVGWLAAGYWAHWLPGTATFAVDTAEQEQAEADDPGASDPSSEGGHAADALVPAPGDARFMRPVLIAAGALFLAAIVLGIPALVMRGPDPPDPAEAHDEH